MPRDGNTVGLISGMLPGITSLGLSLEILCLEGVARFEELGSLAIPLVEALACLIAALVALIDMLFWFTAPGGERDVLGGLLLDGEFSRFNLTIASRAATSVFLGM